MLTVASSTRIFLHREPVDFRKAHDGLAAIVRQALGADPLSGDLFVFLNRARDRVKLLQWDGNGLWLHYKRLEKGTFRMATNMHAERATITRGELSMLLDGIEVKNGRIARRFADRLRIRERTRDDDSDQRNTDRDRGSSRATARP